MRMMSLVYRGCVIKPCTDVACNLPAIDLRLDIRIACNSLQQKFHHAEYFTCDLLIAIFMQFSSLCQNLISFREDTHM